MRPLRPLLVVATIACVCAAGGAAFAATAAGPLVGALQARQAKLDAILKSHPGELAPADKRELGNVLGELIDFREMGRSSLGDDWTKRGDAERKDYLQAFEDLVRANWLRKVDIYRADSVEYLDEKLDGKEGSAKTTVRSKNATTEVVYSFRTIDGKWRVVDYTIDGVSAARNYRAQFTKLLEKKGFAGLVERLRKRKSEIDGEKDEK